MHARKLLLASLLVLLPNSVLAQGAARSLDLDPSIRSAGMGSASTAVFWGGDANYWANPALLGYQRGVRYEYGSTQLVPDLAEGVFFRTSRWSAGGGGLGFAAAAKPNGLGYLRLDYGVSEFTDPEGNPIGAFSSFETIKMFGIGASLRGLLEGAYRARDERMPLLVELFDVAGGYAEKDVLVSLAPTPGGVAETTAKDWGVLGRMTMPIPFDDDRGGPAAARLELAYGHSVINYNDDALLVFASEDGPVPTSRTFRNGGAARLAVGLPRATRRALKKKGLGWMLPGLDPYVSVGASFDREGVQAGADPSGRYDVDRWGVEFSLGNMVTMRYGHVRDVLGDIDGSTWGLGLGLDLGVAGFRFDHAEVPQASGLREVKREGWTVYVDPVALLSATR